MASVIRSTRPLCSLMLHSLKRCQQLQNISSRRLSTTPALNLFFRQLMDYPSYTYTYILADEVTKDAIIIDPVLEMVDRDLQIVNENGLKLKYGVNTHVHADHITGTGEIKKRVPGCQSVLSDKSGAMADKFLAHGEKLTFGNHSIEGRSTPGHTNGCMTFVMAVEKLVFTGDAVLIRGCGRTDFQQGDSRELYKSVHDSIFSLPDDFKLLPAHDYTGQLASSVGEEKKFNTRLTKTVDEFEQIMKNLKLAYPKQIDRALPANLVCGLQELVESKK